MFVCIYVNDNLICLVVWSVINGVKVENIGFNLFFVSFVYIFKLVDFVIFILK